MVFSQLIGLDDHGKELLCVRGGSELLWRSWLGNFELVFLFCEVEVMIVTILEFISKYCRAKIVISSLESDCRVQPPAIVICSIYYFVITFCAVVYLIVVIKPVISSYSTVG